LLVNSSFLSNLDDASVREADETGARCQGFVEDWWREHGEQAVTPGALTDLAYGRSIIREKDATPEANARSAVTRLGLALTRRVSKAFKVTVDGDDAPARVIILTRTKVERAKGGSHQGFALKPVEKSPLKVGNVGGQPKNTQKTLQIKENLSANIGEAPPTSFANVGGAQVPESKGESQHPPTPPTSGPLLPSFGNNVNNAASTPTASATPNSWRKPTREAF
jgi:hypothetical protein